MTLEYLKYFVATYKYGSLYKAAKHLYLSPQGVSRGIKKLEAELGEALFTRTQTGLQPTDFSIYIFPRIKKLIEQVDELYDIAANYNRSEDNVINFGLLGHNAISDTIRLIVEECDERNPDCKMILNVFSADKYEDIYKKLDEGELDIIWTFHTENDKKYRYYTFKRNIIKCALSPLNPLSEKEQLLWSDLKDQPFVMAGQNELYPKLIELECKKYDFIPYEAYYSLDSSHIAKLISSNKALGLFFFEYIDTIKSICPDIVLKSVEPALHMTASLITLQNCERDIVKKNAAYMQNKLIYNDR